MNEPGMSEPGTVESATPQGACTPRGLRAWLATPVILAIFEAPFTWLLFIEPPRSDYWWFWAQRWPVLPGLPALMLVRPMGLESTTQETIAMGVTTAILLAVAVFFATRGRVWFICTLLMCAAYATWLGIASNALYRA